MSIPFVHLHLHTEFSLVDGTVRIPALINKAVETGMPAVAVTDHLNLFSLVKFYRKAESAGIKPIVGADLVLVDPKSNESKLTVLVQNRQGYLALCRLLSRAYQAAGFLEQVRICKFKTKAIIAKKDCFLIGAGFRVRLRPNDRLRKQSTGLARYPYADTAGAPANVGRPSLRQTVQHWFGIIFLAPHRANDVITDYQRSSVLTRETLEARSDVHCVPNDRKFQSSFFADVSHHYGTVVRPYSDIDRRIAGDFALRVPFVQGAQHVVGTGERIARIMRAHKRRSERRHNGVAIMASPMYLSTVPPWANTARAILL